MDPVTLALIVSAVLGGGGLALSAINKKADRGIMKEQLKLESESDKMRAALMKDLTKEKRRTTEKNMAEIRNALREKADRELAGKEMDIYKEQNIANQLMLSQLMQAMMSRKSTPVDTHAAETIMGMIRG